MAAAYLVREHPGSGTRRLSCEGSRRSARSTYRVSPLGSSVSEITRSLPRLPEPNGLANYFATVKTPITVDHVNDTVCGGAFCIRSRAATRPRFRHGFTLPRFAPRQLM